jgi:hypothetical protein
MKMIIKDKEYTICDKCGCYKSSERCYNCDPLKMGDLDCCDQLREYYGIPAKYCSKDTYRAPDLYETNTIHATDENDGRSSTCVRNPYLGKPIFDPDVYKQHHLLEYYFTSRQLRDMGLYNNVPQWQLLKVRLTNHTRIINGMKLHEHKYKDQWQNYKNLTEEQIRALIDQIPKELIETFKAE